MRRRLLTSTALLPLGLFVLAMPACAQQPAPPVAPTAMETEEIARTYKNHHADLNSAIDTETVGSLQLAWSVPTEAPVSHTPIVHDGRVFFTDWNGFAYSVDMHYRAGRERLA